MASPIVTKRQLLWISQESTAYTAESPGTQPLACLDIFDLGRIRQISQLDQREGLRGFGRQRGVAGPFAASVTFRTNAFGTASSTWASTLLPACGFVLSGSDYVCSSLPPQASGSSTKTLTLRFSQDGRYKQIRGAMGTFVITATAGRKVEIEWTFTGVMDPAADAALPTASFPTALPIRYAGDQLTLATYSPVVQEFSIDAGNQVELREDGSDVSGFVGAFIADRQASAKIMMEADLVANFDPEDIFRDSTTKALSVNLGSTGNSLTIAAPAAQILPPVDQDQRGKVMDALDLILCRVSGSDGDDELTLTLG